MVLFQQQPENKDKQPVHSPAAPAIDGVENKLVQKEKDKELEENLHEQEQESYEDDEGDEGGDETDNDDDDDNQEADDGMGDETEPTDNN